jgi:dihydrosphingosine 1-phosphate phosphatase
VSVGPQSEIDVLEQIDYRDERRRKRSNSVESQSSNWEKSHLGSIGDTFVDDTLLKDDQDAKTLQIHIEPLRLRYDVEVVTKLIVYGGIFTFQLD